MTALCSPAGAPPRSAPAQADVDALRNLLDIAANFADNDQRARFILASNWMRDRAGASPQSPAGSGAANPPTPLAFQNVGKTAMDRVIERLDMSDPEACWIWPGMISRGGYGRVNAGGKSPRSTVSVHRLVYETLTGRQLPHGLVIDHLCHTRAFQAGECMGGPTCVHRACANPAHLEPVTHSENNLRSGSITAQNATKVVCLNGHSLMGSDVLITREGWRRCRACERDRDRKRRARGRGRS